MGNKNTAKYDSDNGIPWDDVMNKADTLSDQLRNQEFSAQDIAHIGLRLTHQATFFGIVEFTEYAKNGYKDKETRGEDDASG